MVGLPVRTLHCRNLSFLILWMLRMLGLLFIKSCFLFRRRSRSGTKALREIRFYQKSTHFLIPKLSFCRVVKETLQRESNHDLRIQSKALEALQTSAESFLIRFLEDANLCAIHGKRVTLQQKDVRLVQALKYESLKMPDITHKWGAQNVLGTLCKFL